MAILDTITTWFSNLDLGAFSINLVSALIILLIGFIAAKLARLFIKRILHELSINKTANSILKKNIKLEEGVSATAAYVIYFITFVIMLNHLGITSIILYIITGILLLLILVLFLVGFKDLIPNLFASFALYRKAKFRPGDTIVYKNVEGKIQEINLFETKLKTKKGGLMLIPNSALVKSEVLIKRKSKNETTENRAKENKTTKNKIKKDKTTKNKAKENKAKKEENK